MFETGLSLVEIVVAVLTLLGGGYAGGRASAAARMRAEDRRRLRDDYLLTIMFAEPDGKTLKPVLRYVDAIQQTQRMIDLLPWPERAGWWLAGVHPGRRWGDHTGLTNWRRVTAAVHNHYFGTGSTETVLKAWNDLDPEPARLEDADALWNYLGLMLRATWTRRFGAWRYRVRLLTRRPTPWPWRV